MKGLGLLFSVGTFLLFVFRPTHPQTVVADIILINANVFTASEQNPRAEAIAIKGDRILALGTNQKIRSLAGPKTKQIDVGERLVIPGIMDTHNHYRGAQLPNVTNIDFGEWAPSCSGRSK